MSKISILSIVWYKILPDRFGGQKGIARFNRYLAKHYPLACVCSKDNKPPDELSFKVLRTLPIGKWQFLDPFCYQKIIAAARQEKATHVILEHPYHGIAAIITCIATRARLIVHSHNIESERFRQLGKWWWRILYSYEKRVHRSARLNLFKTENDLDFALTHFKLERDKCLVVPYGIVGPAGTDKTKARSSIRQRHGIKDTDKIFLFAGTLDYEPNAKAVENIYTQIAPRLIKDNAAFKILICGRNRFTSYQYLRNLSHPSVINAGEAKDIDNYFSAADVFINPVREGGGIQTKNIDALSHHCNIVAFETTVEGKLEANDPDKVFVAKKDDWEQFCRQIWLACRPGGNTSTAFFDYYDQQRIAALVSRRIASI